MGSNNCLPSCCLLLTAPSLRFLRACACLVVPFLRFEPSTAAVDRASVLDPSLLLVVVVIVVILQSSLSQSSRHSSLPASFQALLLSFRPFPCTLVEYIYPLDIHHPSSVRLAAIITYTTLSSPSRSRSMRRRRYRTTSDGSWSLITTTVSISISISLGPGVAGSAMTCAGRAAPPPSGA